jgi:exonuclease III
LLLEFQKIDNENYFIQCKRNQSGNFKGFIEWLQQANPDVICLQEIKATEDQILLKLLQMRAIRQYYYSATKRIAV